MFDDHVAIEELPLQECELFNIPLVLCHKRKMIQLRHDHDPTKIRVEQWVCLFVRKTVSTIGSDMSREEVNRRQNQRKDQLIVLGQEWIGVQSQEIRKSWACMTGEEFLCLGPWVLSCRASSVERDSGGYNSRVTPNHLLSWASLSARSILSRSF